MKWINAKKELPKVPEGEYSVGCIICWKGQVFEASFSIDSLDGEIDWYPTNERISIYDDDDVTHWMYLPLPPKKTNIK